MAEVRRAWDAQRSQNYRTRKAIRKALGDAGVGDDAGGKAGGPGGDAGGADDDDAPGGPQGGV